jgi:AmiR/NasT family two-component response regulator
MEAFAGCMRDELIGAPFKNYFTDAGILAEEPETANIPVVALSANAMPDDIEKGMTAGVFRYLTKPIKVRQFMDTLDSALALVKHRASRAGALRGAL